MTGVEHNTIPIMEGCFHVVGTWKCVRMESTMIDIIVPAMEQIMP